MKNTNILYEDINSIKLLINEGTLKAEIPYLVRIYVANATKDEALIMAQEIQALLPNAKIAGSSASGIIFNGEQFGDKTLVCISEYTDANVHVAVVSWENKNAKEVAQSINNAFIDNCPKLMHVFCSDNYYDVHDMVCEFNEINSRTMLIGGVCGEVLPKGITGYAFTPQGIAEKSIVLVAICAETFYAYIGVNTSHEAISAKHTLTKCSEGNIYTIDNIEADQWFRDQLGINLLKEYKDWEIIADNDEMIRFPLILEGFTSSSRFIKYDSERKGIAQYFSKLPENTQFRIGYVSPVECAKESLRVCNEIIESPVETLFCYSCLFRRLYLNNCASWELTPYENMNICGAFVMGEIAFIKGKNEFLNGACCILGVSETETYIRPDIKAFDELSQIKDDTSDLLNLALKKQSENLSKHNDELLEELISQQKLAQNQLYVDFNTGMPNFLKYKEDKKTKNFNKICMAKIENSDLIVTLSGHEAYGEIIKSAVNAVRDYFRKLPEYAIFEKYVFNENTFFITANDQVSDSHFIEISKKLFEQFRFISLKDYGEVLVSRVVVVVNEDELIEIALNAFQANKNIQTPYLLCTAGSNDDSSALDEFKIISVINRAIESDGITPYFQGIFDNQEKTIIKYEALMRLVDFDGTVYLPGEFLPTAKKYLLYNYLSKVMVQKVFDLFEGKKASVSINFSVHDINSPEMQDMIFSRLAKMKDASNFIIEILEDEEFRDINMLKEFIAKSKKYGVKIAIDDFGSGYSNLLEIANIRPDYIKVDGGIIRNLHDNDLNKKILDIIVYMGEHLNTEIIAEFVENEKIQNQVAINQIRYSQGYYFARPLPFDRLELE